jgi:hypothetical protein
MAGKTLAVYLGRDNHTTLTCKQMSAGNIIFRSTIETQDVVAEVTVNLSPAEWAVFKGELLKNG